MKKFFKALALVLALTLIVGVVPATAARAEVMKDKTLYLDGAKGTSEDGKACAVKAKKAIYKLAGYTKDTKEGHEFKAVAQKDGIVTITKNYVKAAAIGTVDVDIYDGDVKIGTTTVKVKKNATADSLVLKVDDGDVPEKLIAGAKYTFKLPRVGKDTDERRIFVNGTQLTDIKDHARQFEYTCTEDDAKAGKITVKYESFQSKTYNAYTQTKTVEIPVTLGTMEKATQTKYNAFKLTFANEGTAKAAVDATKPSLTQGNAAVTENTEIVKVFQVGTNGERIAAFIQSLAQLDADKKTVNVVMFADLAEKTKYEVVYGDVTLSFVAADWTPESVKGYEKTYTPVDDGENKGGTAELATLVYSVGDQGQNVDITDKVVDLGTFTYSDPNLAKNDYTKYSLNGDIVDFYVNDLKIDAHVVFTYFGGTTATEYTNDFTVSSSDDRHFTVLYYLMDSNLGTQDPGTKREAYISADDSTMRLDVRIKSEIVIDGVTTTLTEYIYGTNENVRFVTANTDKLAIQEKDTNRGYAYAPKPANAQVPVWVYYGDKVCDADASVEGVQPIYVTVYDHKRLGTATVIDETDGKIGISYAAEMATANVGNANTGYDASAFAEDFESWKITALDEQQRPYYDVTVKIEKLTNVEDGKIQIGTLYGAVGDLTTTLTSASPVPFETQLGDIRVGWKNAGVLKFNTTTTNTSAQTVSYKITLEDNNSTKKLVYKIAFKVKDTSASKVTRIGVDTDNNALKARVLGYDSQGYTCCIYDLDTSATLAAYKAGGDNNKLYLGFFKSADGSEKVNDLGTAWRVLKDTENVLGGGLTKITASANGVLSDASFGVTTGEAISVAKYINAAEGFADKWIDNGTYAARAYKREGTTSPKVVGVATGNLSFTAGNYYSLSWKWNQAYTDKASSNVIDVIDDALEFTFYAYDANGDKIAGWTKERATLTTLLNAGVPINVSYTVKEDTSITILYLYIDVTDIAGTPLANYLGGDPLYVETPILRTIYTNVEK